MKPSSAADKVLLILHGWQSSKQKWQPVKKEIEKEGIRVMVPDLPGFKQETKLDRPWDLEDYVQWLENYIKEREELYPEGREGFFLLGHSFGGGLALKYATSRPDQLAGLVLVSAAVVRKKSKKAKCLTRLAGVFSRLSFLPGYGLFTKFFYYHILKRPDYVAAEGPLKKTFEKVIRRDLTHLFPEIEIPTLIVWGREDRVTPLKEAKIMKKGIPGSQMAVLEKVGHAPHKEAVKGLVREIVHFITNN